MIKEILITLEIFLLKHIKCLKYSWIKNSISFLLPILLFVGSLQAFSNSNKQQKVIFNPIDESQILSYFPGGDDDLLLYTPNTSYYNDLMEILRYKLNIIEGRLRPFDNVEKLNNYLELHKHNRDFAIIFENNTNSTIKTFTHDPPQELIYTIRTRNNNFQTNKLYLNNIYDVAAKETDEYISSGFLALQQCIDISYIESITKHPYNYQYEFQKFPVNERTKSKFTELSVIGVVLILMYSFTLINMVLIPMVGEKEDGIKEFLRIATPYSYLNNITFFILNLFFGVMIFLASMCFAYYYGVLDHIKYICLGLLLLLYLISGISFSYLVSTAFDSVFYAKVGGILFYFAPLFIILYNEELLSHLIPLFNNLLIIKGFKIFDIFGMKGLQFNCNNIFDIPPDTHYSLMHIYVLLIFNSVLYLSLYYYISHVFPGKCGTPRPFYFPFTWLYNCKNKIEDTTDYGSNEPLSNECSADISVKIRGLSKKFDTIRGSSKFAVDNLSMNIYRNQITALLGHNGAGKTTTMSMITGIIPKTSGMICVDGECNINEYRHTLGYCPQNNVFMRYFTCRDHLIFFGRLRGLSSKAANEISTNLLGDLRMTEKSNEYGINLSGGMKRRLCLGNAIIGNTKIVILDEPSSGLDPESRRELWDILLELRKNHSILITTHYMEEAEILGDKIAIISNGKLLCYGTSTALKRKYATGYLLKLLTNEKFDEDKTMLLIKNYINNATKKNHVHPTVIINLPYEDQQNYSEMLENLEMKLDVLGISSISITNSSLEDVFISCETYNTTETDSCVNKYSEFDLEQICYEDNMLCFSFQQCLGIMYKKLIFMKKEFIYYLISIIFPIFAIVICFYSINVKINNHQYAVPFTLSMESIPNSEILLVLENPLNHTNDYKSIIMNNLKNTSLKSLNTYNDTIEDELLKLELKNRTHYNEHIPSTILIYNDIDNSVEKKKINSEIHLIRILFSGNSYHSSGATLNLISNTILEKITNTQYKIQTKNAPLIREKTKITKSDFDFYEMFVPMAMFFYILFYVSLPFQEECTEFKKLQLVSPIVYWFAFIFFDILVHLIFCSLLVFVHWCADYDGIFQLKDYLEFSIIYFLYGLAYLPFIYIICKLFSTMSTLYSFMSYVFVLSSLLASFLSANLDNMKKFSTLICTLLLSPDYALRHALSSKFILFSMQQDHQYEFNFDHNYGGTNIHVEPDNETKLSRFYGRMIALSIVLFIYLVIVLENIYRTETIKKCFSFFQIIYDKIFYKNNKLIISGTLQSQNENEDVREEYRATQTLLRDKKFEDNAIIVSDVYKNYGHINAVNGINFTVRKGECFGLLGMNGAGKTTTFKMLTHDITISKGSIYFNGMKNSDYLYKEKFGYCPQVDALNHFMTAYEILKYTAWIRGIKRGRLHQEVMNWLTQTDLLKYKDIPIKEYSGGTKRKLNTAIAMITNPSLVFLDEPTTGVDPVSRRFIWNCTKRFNSKKKSIILTSHSMDECEQLCNRLAIMAKGQLMCIGPVQQLKSTYSKGFIICIIIENNQPQENIDFIVKEMYKLFESVSLQEAYAERLKFLICEKNFKWSNIFGKMQTLYNNNSNIINDFSISETSLEDIFLQFAKESNAKTDLVEVTSV